MKNCILISLILIVVLFFIGSTLVFAEQSVTVSAENPVVNGDQKGAGQKTLIDAEQKAFGKILAQYIDSSSLQNMLLVNNYLGLVDKYLVSATVLKTKLDAGNVIVYVKCVFNDEKLQQDIKNDILQQRLALQTSGQRVSTAIALRIRGITNTNECYLDAINTYQEQLEASGFKLQTLDRDINQDYSLDNDEFSKRVLVVAKSQPNIFYLVVIDIDLVSDKPDSVSKSLNASATMRVNYFYLPDNKEIGTYQEIYSLTQSTETALLINLVRKCAGNNVKRCIGDLTTNWTAHKKSKSQQ